jgi:hypothetical protein
MILVLFARLLTGWATAQQTRLGIHPCIRGDTSLTASIEICYDDSLTGLAPEPTTQARTADDREEPGITVDIVSDNHHFGLRYCINTASLRFVPTEGQGAYLDQLEDV